MTDHRDNLEAAISSMLDDNRLRFNEIISDVLQSKAVEAIAAYKDELRLDAFNDPDEDAPEAEPKPESEAPEEPTEEE